MIRSLSAKLKEIHITSYEFYERLEIQIFVNYLVLVYIDKILLSTILTYNSQFNSHFLKNWFGNSFRELRSLDLTRTSNQYSRLPWILEMCYQRAMVIETIRVFSRIGTSRSCSITLNPQKKSFSNFTISNWSEF